MLTTGDHDDLVLKTMSLNCIIGLPGWLVVKNLPGMQEMWVRFLG